MAITIKGDEKTHSGMDIGFIGKPHEWDPRRLYSQTGADWQYRVDFDRMRSERLARLRAQMKADDLAALALSGSREISVEDLHLSAPPGPEQDGDANAGALPDYLDSIERKAILEALGKTDFNRTPKTGT